MNLFLDQRSYSQSIFVQVIAAKKTPSCEDITANVDPDYPLSGEDQNFDAIASKDGAYINTDNFAKGCLRR